MAFTVSSGSLFLQSGLMAAIFNVRKWVERLSGSLDTDHGHLSSEKPGNGEVDSFGSCVCVWERDFCEFGLVGDEEHVGWVKQEESRAGWCWRRGDRTQSYRWYGLCMSINDLVLKCYFVVHGESKVFQMLKLFKCWVVVELWPKPRVFVLVIGVWYWWQWWMIWLSLSLQLVCWWGSCKQTGAMRFGIIHDIRHGNVCISDFFLLDLFIFPSTFWQGIP